MDKLTQYIHLQYENMPCYYQLSFDAKTPALIVRVHEDFVGFLPTLKGAHITDSLRKNLKLKRFEENWLGETFGFGGCFKRMPTENNFLVYSVEIPVLEKFHMVRCGYCQGHGKDILFGGRCQRCAGLGEEKKMKPCWSCEGRDFPDENCYRCKGSGKEFDSWMDHQSLYAISATFTVFFSLMWFGQQVDKFVACKLPQLLFVETNTVAGMSGTPIYGTLGIPFTRWLRQLPVGYIEKAQEALKAAWQKMNGKEFGHIDKFNTWCEVREKGWLSISCPGDRTGIYPAHHGLREEEGYEFHCHNVDHPRQQLTLLACLASLCDMVRGSM